MRTKVKIALLSSFTVDFFKDIIQSKLKSEEIDSEFYIAPFGQFRTEIINHKSNLYNFTPDIIILFLNPGDIFEDIFENPLKYKLEEKETLVENIIDEILSLIEVLRKRLSSAIVMTNNYFSCGNVLGPLDTNSDYSLSAAINSSNLYQYKKLKNLNGVCIFDLQKVVLENGLNNLIDERFWYLAKCPFGKKGVSKIASEIVSCIKGTKGITKKCLVLDLDNTLWGGIIGEDGFEGIQLSNDNIGKAFFDFQMGLRNLNKMGFILTICSKNNMKDALEVIEKHPFMVLKKEDFALMKINWEDKVENIKKIASELNIGTDSIVFFDDNPFERELVNKLLPEVCVVDMPNDPSYYASKLFELDLFNKVSLSEEDKIRTDIYHSQVKRSELQKSYKSVEEFFYSLDMQLKIKKANDFTIPRISQLTQKTNQFNMTTKRYTESEIKSFAQSDDSTVYSVELIDKFGSSGIVGVAIILKTSEECEIDTFLLSCRVLGRTIENAFIAYIYKMSVGNPKIKTLTGLYFPTKKNHIAKDFYERMKFKRINENMFKFDLNANAKLRIPEWIKIV